MLVYQRVYVDIEHLPLTMPVSYCIFTFHGCIMKHHGTGYTQGRFQSVDLQTLSNTCVCFSGMFVNFSVPSLKITARSWKMLLGGEVIFHLEHYRPIFAGVNWNWCILVFGRLFLFRSFQKIRKTQLNKISNGHWKPGGGKSYPPWN